MLEQWLTGDFSSEKQSKNDTQFFDIRLHMKPIWKNKGWGHWMYVEQARADKQEAPYRQRIYHLIKGEGDTLISQVYELPTPQRFIGAWREKNGLWKTLHPDSLIPRKGCSIYLVFDKKSKQFKGSTKNQECVSSLRGASYASSEVTLSKRMLISWDRGWDANHQQVWGATKGGYQFVKVN